MLCFPLVWAHRLVADYVGRVGACRLDLVVLSPYFFGLTFAAHHLRASIRTRALFCIGLGIGDAHDFVSN